MHKTMILDAWMVKVLHVNITWNAHFVFSGRLVGWF